MTLFQKPKPNEIELLKFHFENLEVLEWNEENDNEVNNSFLNLNDLIENKLRNQEWIDDWRLIVISFQRRALFDTLKTKENCIKSIRNLIGRIEFGN